MLSDTTTFEQFRDEMIAAGYEEVLERHWEAGVTIPIHTHPFEANALVIQGEMWLAEQGGTAQRLLRIPAIVTADSGVVTSRSGDRDRRNETVKHTVSMTATTHWPRCITRCWPWGRSGRTPR